MESKVVQIIIVAYFFVSKNFSLKKKKVTKKLKPERQKKKPYPVK